MLSGDTITDAQIRQLQVEAERENDNEIVRVCQRAYRDNGGGANPFARLRIAALLNERLTMEDTTEDT